MSDLTGDGPGPDPETHGPLGDHVGEPAPGAEGVADRHVGPTDEPEEKGSVPPVPDDTSAPDTQAGDLTPDQSGRSTTDDPDPDQDDTLDSDGVIVVHKDDCDGPDEDGNCGCDPEVIPASEAGFPSDHPDSRSEVDTDSLDPSHPDSTQDVDPAIGRSDKQEQSVAGMNRAHYQQVIDQHEAEYRRSIAETVERHPIFGVQQQDVDRAVADLDSTRERAQENYERALERAGITDEDGNVLIDGIDLPDHSDADGLPSWADGVGDDDLAPDADLDDDEHVGRDDDEPARQEFPPAT